MTTFQRQSSSHALFSIDMPPLKSEELAFLHSSLRSRYFTYLNGVLALTVLALGATVRVMSLGFEHDTELLHLSLYIGGWIGLFSGVSIKGDKLSRIQLTLTGVVVCIAASLSASMLVTLFVGYTASWITAINILASALAGMWLLTYFDDATKELGLIKNVNLSQLDYIERAAKHFDSLMEYVERIQTRQRVPVIGEYWVVRNWISDKIKNTAL